MKEHTKEPALRIPTSQDALLEQICAYARECVAQKLLLRDVARYCGVSVSTITQLFRKTMDTTFHGYLTQLRMERAGELIREGVSLEEAGRQVGYTDHSSFYRAFCRSFGQSPREYRRSVLKK